MHKVYCTSSPTPQELSEIPQTSQKERLDFLRDCMAQNHFAYYLEELSQSPENNTSTTWWHILQNYLQHSTPPPVSDMNFLCWYLFALALSDSPEKHTEISEILQTLPRERETSLCQMLLNMPPIIGAHILHPGSESIWSSVSYKMRDDYSIAVQWIKIALRYFSPVDKEEFIRTFFHSYATKEFLQTYLMHTSSSIQRSVSELLSSEMNQVCKESQIALNAFSKKIFLQLSTKPSSLRSLSSIERKYILLQLAEKELRHPYAYKIISNLSRDDLQWFYSRVLPQDRPKLPSLIVEWALQVRSSEETLEFLKYIPSIFSEQELINTCLKLAENQLYPELTSYFTAFHEKIIPSLVYYNADLLNCWIQHLLQTSNDMSTCSVISSFLSHLDTDSWQSFLPYLFKRNQESSSYALTIYACLPINTQKFILNYLITYRFEILLDWIRTLTPSTENKMINPHIRYAALQNLQALLQSIDPSASTKIKELSLVNTDAETQALLDLYLPTEIDTHDPSVQYNLSLQKCIRYLSDPEITRYGRLSWTPVIFADFFKRLPCVDWIEDLIVGIPQQRLPLFFRLFYSEIRDLFIKQKADQFSRWIEYMAIAIQAVSSQPLNPEEKQNFMIDLLTAIPLKLPEDISMLIEQLQRAPEHFFPSLSLLYQYYVHHKNKSLFQQSFSLVFKYPSVDLLVGQLLSYPLNTQDGLEQFIWEIVEERWKQETPSEQQFYEQVEKILTSSSSHEVKKGRFYNLCTTYLHIERNVFKWLEKRPDLLAIIQTWYLPLQNFASCKPTLFSIGLLHVLDPSILKWMISHQISTSDIALLEELTRFLDIHDLKDEYLLNIPSFRSFVLRNPFIDSLHPNLYRVKIQLRNQVTSKKSDPCCIS